jgi:hypothetical protein
LFGRKPQAEPAAEKSAPAGSTATSQVIMRLSSELAAVDTAPLPAEKFQAAAGFKKVQK